MTKERFAVRTITRDENLKMVCKTTIAEGRPEAIVHAERIGKIDAVDHDKVRAFLDGGPMTHGYLPLCSGDSCWGGAAGIYLVD